MASLWSDGRSFPLVEVEIGATARRDEFMLLAGVGVQEIAVSVLTFVGEAIWKSN